MKTIFLIMIRPAPSSLGGLAVLFFSFFSAATADQPGVNAQNSAYQSSVAQEGVRQQTEKIEGEISELLVELKANGLSSSDANLLSGAASHLRNLSQDDMQKVINTLQSASMNKPDADRQKSLVTAFEQQNSLSLKLKALAAELAAQESQRELALKLQALIERQSANLRGTGMLLDSAPASAKANAPALHAVAASEQTAIGGEIDLLYQILGTTSIPATADASGPDLAKAVLDAMNSHALHNAAASATSTTATGPPSAALDQQKTLQDDLTDVLRVALSKLDAVQQMEMAKSQLDQIVSDQKDLADQAKHATLDGPTMAERQEKLSDQAAATQALLQATSPPAASQLDQAQMAMQQSASALQTDKNPADAAPQQQAVADALQKTEDLLSQQIAAAQKQQNASPVDRLSQLQQLQAKIDQAQQNQQTSAADLQKLQQDATNLSTPAANDIADAKDQLQTPATPPASQPPAPAPAQGQPAPPPPPPPAQTAQQAPAPPPPPPAQTAQQAPAPPPPPPAQTAQQAPAPPPPPAGQSPASGNQPPPPSQPGAQTAQQPPPPPSAPTPQQEAAADKFLAQASDALKQQEAALQASAQQYQALSKEDQQLGQAEQEIHSADQAMTGADKNNTTAAADLTQAQNSVDQMKQNEPADEPADAKDALQHASDDLKAGAMEAVQAKDADAQASGEQATEALQKAQAGVEHAMAQVAEQSHSDEIGRAEFGDEEPKLGRRSGDDVGRLLGGYGAQGTTAGVIGGLKPKDRAAMSQLGEEKSPPEFSSQVQQYMKNIADASDAR